MDILQRITELRNERNWSKNYLAKMSDLPQSTVSNLYNRSHAPSISTLESICKGFGISLAQFFNINNEEDTILSEEQKQLLLEWEKLSREQKLAIFNLLKNM